LWLPPTRTFSALASRAGLRPQRIRRGVVGVEHVVADGAAAVVGVRWFRESTANQLAALFSLDSLADAGHYYLATAGDVEIAGWTVDATAELLPHLRAVAQYSAGQAGWRGRRGLGALRRIEPRLVRHGVDRVSDVVLSLNLDVPRTDTRVLVGYRWSAASRRDDPAAAAAIASGRFRMEVRQRLPYQPPGGGSLNIYLALRSLMLGEDAGALYDELMTVHPPSRLTGGLQVWF
jgi:hypothetical protein